jgi:peptide/nickel transport system substrate-binding protein
MHEHPLRRALIAALAIVACVALAACGSSNDSASTTNASAPAADVAPSATDTLRVAYTADPAGGVDPSTFYDIEGQSVILSTYEGLLTYAPDSSQIKPLLAESWDVSSDGTTYTFKLRDGVTFHDGGKLSAQVVKDSLQRFVDLAGGPSYMLADITKMTVVDPLTLKVRLKQRNNAFLSYLASMYGPKIVGPQALREHPGKKGAAWFQTHADGSGPFRLDSYKRGRDFRMSRFAGYWGTEPYFAKIVISIIPDVSSQRLQLESGDLDLITHGVPVAELETIAHGGRLQVVHFPAALRQRVSLNTSKAPFDDIRARQAFVAALDIPSAVASTYGAYAKAATSQYPGVMGVSAPVTKPAAGSAPKLGKLTMTYPSAEPDSKRLAEFMQQSLQAAGFDVTLRGATVSEAFAVAGAPQKAPEVWLGTPNPDSADPYTWAQPAWASAGGLNVYATPDKQVDRLVEQANAAASPEQATALYAQIGAHMNEQAASVPVDDLDDVFVAAKDLTGFSHVPVYVWTPDLARLARTK